MYSERARKLLDSALHRDSMRFAQLVFKMDLTRENSALMRDAWPSRVLAWDARKELIERVMDAESLGAWSSGRVLERDIKQLGDRKLQAVRWSLRLQIERMLRSEAVAPGSFVLLGEAGEGGGGGAPAAVPEGGCSPLHACSRVQNAAAACHEQWRQGPERLFIKDWATKHGYDRVVLVPVPLHTAEDSTRVKRRKEVDPVHLRLDILAPHVMNNPFFMPIVGIVEKPPWVRPKSSHEQWEWAEKTYQQHISWASGWVELCEWDAQGPLLLDRIPGLHVQPPPGKKWLFVASPILCGVSGDLQGVWRITGLKQYTCPWCTSSFDTFDSGERRGSPAFLTAQISHFNAVLNPASAPAVIRTATDALRVVGFRKYVHQIVGSPAVVPSFLCIPHETWRLPHTRPNFSFFDYICPDILHLAPQGVFKRGISLVLCVVSRRGDMSKLEGNFARVASTYWSIPSAMLAAGTGSPSFLLK